MTHNLSFLKRFSNETTHQVNYIFVILVVGIFFCDGLQEKNSEVVRTVSHSEEYNLKEKAMASILKLVSMQDMANLAGSKED